MIVKECAAYLSKDAQIDFLGTTKKLFTTAAPYAIGIPLVAGLGVGYLLSRGTSPSEASLDITKQNIIRNELEEELALTERDLALRRMKKRLADKLGRKDILR